MKVAAGKRERERVFLILIKDPTKAGPENRRERWVFWGNWGS